MRFSGGSQAANYAPQGLAYCRISSARPPSGLGGLPARGLLCRPFSGQVGRLPLQAGLPQLLSQVAGAQVQGGVLAPLRYAIQPVLHPCQIRPIGVRETGALLLIRKHGSSETPPIRKHGSEDRPALLAVQLRLGAIILTLTT